MLVSVLFFESSFGDQINSFKFTFHNSIWKSTPYSKRIRLVYMLRATTFP